MTHRGRAGERAWLRSKFYWGCVATMAGIFGLIAGLGTGSLPTGLLIWALAFVGLVIYDLAEMGR